MSAARCSVPTSSSSAGGGPVGSPRLHGMSQGFDWKTPRDAGAAGASPSAGDDPSPTREQSSADRARFGWSHEKHFPRRPGATPNAVARESASKIPSSSGAFSPTSPPADDPGSPSSSSVDATPEPTRGGVGVGAGVDPNPNPIPGGATPAWVETRRGTRPVTTPLTAAKNRWDGGSPRMFVDAADASPESSWLTGAGAGADADADDDPPAPAALSFGGGAAEAPPPVAFGAPAAAASSSSSSSFAAPSFAFTFGAPTPPIVFGAPQPGPGISPGLFNRSSPVADATKAVDAQLDELAKAKRRLSVMELEKTRVELAASRDSLATKGEQLNAAAKESDRKREDLREALAKAEAAHVADDDAIAALTRELTILTDAAASSAARERETETLLAEVSTSSPGANASSPSAAMAEVITQCAAATAEAAARRDAMEAKKLELERAVEDRDASERALTRCREDLRAALADAASSPRQQRTLPPSPAQSGGSGAFRWHSNDTFGGGETASSPSPSPSRSSSVAVSVTAKANLSPAAKEEVDLRVELYRLQRALAEKDAELELARVSAADAARANAERLDELHGVLTSLQAQRRASVAPPSPRRESGTGRSETAMTAELDILRSALEGKDKELIALAAERAELETMRLEAEAAAVREQEAAELITSQFSALRKEVNDAKAASLEKDEARRVAESAAHDAAEDHAAKVRALMLELQEARKTAEETAAKAEETEKRRVEAEAAATAAKKTSAATTTDEETEKLKKDIVRLDAALLVAAEQTADKLDRHRAAKAALEDELERLKEETKTREEASAREIRRLNVALRGAMRAAEKSGTDDDASGSDAETRGGEKRAPSTPSARERRLEIEVSTLRRALEESRAAAAPRSPRSPPTTPSPRRVPLPETPRPWPSPRSAPLPETPLASTYDAPLAALASVARGEREERLEDEISKLHAALREAAGAAAEEDAAGAAREKQLKADLDAAVFARDEAVAEASERETALSREVAGLRESLDGALAAARDAIAARAATEDLDLAASSSAREDALEEEIARLRAALEAALTAAAMEDEREAASAAEANARADALEAALAEVTEGMANANAMVEAAVFARDEAQAELETLKNDRVGAEPPHVTARALEELDTLRGEVERLSAALDAAPAVLGLGEDPEDAKWRARENELTTHVARLERALKDAAAAVGASEAAAVDAAERAIASGARDGDLDGIDAIGALPERDSDDETDSDASDFEVAAPATSRAGEAAAAAATTTACGSAPSKNSAAASASAAEFFEGATPRERYRSRIDHSSRPTRGLGLFAARYGHGYGRGDRAPPPPRVLAAIAVAVLAACVAVVATVFFSGDSCGWSATSVVDEWLSYVVHAKYRPACAPRSRPS